MTINSRAGYFWAKPQVGAVAVASVQASGLARFSVNLRATRNATDLPLEAPGRKCRC
jgi:hypothetical protein